MFMPMPESPRPDALEEEPRDPFRDRGRYSKRYWSSGAHHAEAGLTRLDSTKTISDFFRRLPLPLRLLPPPEELHEWLLCVSRTRPGCRPQKYSIQLMAVDLGSWFSRYRVDAPELRLGERVHGPGPAEEPDPLDRTDMVRRLTANG